MWTKLMDTKNGYTAEMWKELFSAEALVVRVVPSLAGPDAVELAPHEIYVPWGKLHVAQEIVRKI
ncbi:MAG: hypothetical protein V3S01_00185 [Dehalococcoidia bacterium]